MSNEYWDAMRTHGGPAYPCEPIGQTGMSLRDYFAAHAPMPDLLTFAELLKTFNPHITDSGNIETAKQLARFAYAYADAMLKEREQPK